MDLKSHFTMELPRLRKLPPLESAFLTRIVGTQIGLRNPGNVTKHNLEVTKVARLTDDFLQEEQALMAEAAALWGSTSSDYCAQGIRLGNAAAKTGRKLQNLRHNKRTPEIASIQNPLETFQSELTFERHQDATVRETLQSEYHRFISAVVIAAKMSSRPLQQLMTFGQQVADLARISPSTAQQLVQRSTENLEKRIQVSETEQHQTPTWVLDSYATAMERLSAAATAANMAAETYFDPYKTLEKGGIFALVKGKEADRETLTTLEKRLRRIAADDTAIEAVGAVIKTGIKPAEDTFRLLEEHAEYVAFAAAAAKMKVQAEQYSAFLLHDAEKTLHAGETALSFVERYRASHETQKTAKLLVEIGYDEWEQHAEALDLIAESPHADVLIPAYLHWSDEENQERSEAILTLSYAKSTSASEMRNLVQRIGNVPKKEAETIVAEYCHDRSNGRTHPASPQKQNGETAIDESAERGNSSGNDRIEEARELWTILATDYESLQRKEEDIFTEAEALSSGSTGRLALAIIASIDSPHLPRIMGDGEMRKKYLQTLPMKPVSSMDSFFAGIDPAQEDYKAKVLRKMDGLRKG